MLLTGQCVIDDGIWGFDVHPLHPQNREGMVPLFLSHADIDTQVQLSESTLGPVQWCLLLL